jgi:hypothetical protein
MPVQENYYVTRPVSTRYPSVVQDHEYHGHELESTFNLKCMFGSNNLQNTTNKHIKQFQKCENDEYFQ